MCHTFDGNLTHETKLYMQADVWLKYLPGLSGQVSNITVSLQLLFPCELDASSCQQNTTNQHPNPYLPGDQEWSESLVNWLAGATCTVWCVKIKSYEDKLCFRHNQSTNKNSAGWKIKWVMQQNDSSRKNRTHVQVPHEERDIKNPVEVDTH